MSVPNTVMQACPSGHKNRNDISLGRFHFEEKKKIFKSQILLEENTFSDTLQNGGTGSRSRQISEFLARLVYIANSSAAKTVW